MAKRRTFQRTLGALQYRKLFVLVTEGKKTEPQYFSIFQGKNFNVTIKCLKGAASAPPHLLRRIKRYIKEEGLEPGDEAWLILDKDQWTDEQLQELTKWANSEENLGLALSNPHFEFWLLLHFEDGLSITSVRNCRMRLERYLPNYDKSLEQTKITYEQVEEAIRRAEQIDDPPCVSWPKKLGSTTVYRLVKNILEA